MTAPFQGKTQVPVFEVITSATFSKAREQSKLVIPVGKNLNGNIKILDLAQERNLLIAGSVTSGKTKFVNAIIASMVMCYQPDELKIILDDVTRVELLSYNGLPHLVRPVVTQLEETLEAIGWLDAEIHSRYRKMSTAEVSNIEGYNHKNKKDKMAYLVFVIYELSDLMIGKRSSAEPIICRIAQSGPDAGIHMIIATQRPERAVLTPNLKAQFPARICFHVVAAEDSRAILDMDGAEKLKEESEMLYLSSGAAKPEHLRGCSISDDEIDNAVSSAKRVKPDANVK